MFKILKHKYLVREVHVRNGVLKILTDRAGNTNYELWSKPEESDGENFLLELENVKLSDLKLEYINKALLISQGESDG